MIQPIFNLRECNTILSKSHAMQVIFVHENNPTCTQNLKQSINNFGKEHQDFSVNFYSVDTNSRKVQPIVDLYHLEHSPAVLFFKNGKFEKKMEGEISVESFNQNMQLSLQELEEEEIV